MNQEFLYKVMWQGHYTRKPGTKGSLIHEDYFEAQGLADQFLVRSATMEVAQAQQRSNKEMLLPYRLNFVEGDSVKVSRSGRGLKPKAGRITAAFTLCEKSPYYQGKRTRVGTSVWQVPGYRGLFYGTIGIAVGEDQMEDNGDLILFHTTYWEDVQVFVFKGLAKPNEAAGLAEVVAFLEGEGLI